MRNSEEKQKMENQSKELVGRLYRENYEQLIHYVKGKISVGSPAEDIVQDAFCEALKKVEVLSIHPKPEGWLMETVKFKIREQNRRQQILYSIDQFEMQLKRREVRYDIAELQLIMEHHLDVQERTLFYQYYMLGYSIRELAEKENKTEGNLRVKMYRLRKKLKMLFCS